MMILPRDVTSRDFLQLTSPFALLCRYNKRMWESVPFKHPSTFDTLAMSPELKTEIKADLLDFTKGEQFYHRAGKLRKLLIQTTNRSVIVIEDIDCSLDLSERKKAAFQKHTSETKRTEAAPAPPAMKRTGAEDEVSPQFSLPPSSSAAESLYLRF